MNILILVIVFIIAACLGGYIVNKRLRPQLKHYREYDKKTYYENELLKEDNFQLNKINQSLKAEYAQLDTQKQAAISEITNLNTSISKIEKQAQEAADLFYKTKMQIAQENLEQSLEKEAQKYQENIENFQIQYDETVAEMMKQYSVLENNIAEMKATNDAAVEAAKRAEEMKNKQDFYRIQLTAADVHEIELLRQVEPYLRDKEPLNKVIWKCYYEKPTTDLIGRVIGSGSHTGIYKITEISTGKCYVGQAANLSDRWKQHIKRGVGADAPTRNKLYPAMIAAGPENFTFEVVEICDRSALDEREKYWTDYFKAQEFGFSIRKG